MSKKNWFDWKDEQDKEFFKIQYPVHVLNKLANPV